MPNVAIDELWKRLGSLAPLIFTFAAGVAAIYGLGLADGPASAKALEAVSERVTAIEDKLAIRDTEIRNDLEQIRRQEALTSQKLDLTSQKLDQILQIMLEGRR